LQTAYTKDLKHLYTHLKHSAKKRGILFELTMPDLNDLTFPITCPILGMPLFFNCGTPKDNSYSVDRIDSTKGYVADNIVIVSYRANRLKSDATLEELREIYTFYSTC